MGAPSKEEDGDGNACGYTSVEVKSSEYQPMREDHSGSVDVEYGGECEQHSNNFEAVFL